MLLAAEDTPRLDQRLDQWIAAMGGDGVDLPAITDPPDGGPARLAVLDVTPQRLEVARKVVAQGEPWRGRTGVWFEPRGLLAEGGRLAFVFPGVEPTFEPRVDDLARHFEAEARAARLPVDADGRDSDGRDCDRRDGDRHADTSGMSELERQARGIVAVSRFLHRVLGRLAVVPDLVAGHSIGEWSANVAAGVIADDAVDELIDRLQPGAVEVPDVVYLALGAGVTVAQGLIADLDRTVVSHDNCPQQSVVCGPPGEIGRAAARCRARGVLAQELPFRSGFHSPLFAAYTPVLRNAFGSSPIRPARIPLWSATTCQPYPPDPDDMVTLAERHLVEPVRFRELVLALHDAGARVFVQAGVGNLTGFVADTLRGRPAVAVAANTPKRSGLAQLHHLAAAVWVEGGNVDLANLPTDHPRPAPPGTGTRPPAVQSHLQPAAAGTGTGGSTEPASAPGPRRATAPATPAVETGVWRQRFALDVEPAWGDHALCRQARDWPHLDDRFPLVPMAAILDVLIASASRLHPELVPVAIEDAAAFRYLEVDPPTDATIRATTLDGQPNRAVRVKVGIDGHAQGTVVLARRYPTAPPAPRPRLADPRPNHIEADRLYTDRHMFHGPAYQGVEQILTLAGNGSRALIRTPTGPGALLDNAGQLMGHWLSAHAEEGRLILPSSIRRVELFGPHPTPGTLIDCTVTIDRFDDRALRADMDLRVDRQLWCRVIGWEDRRFAVDAQVFEMLKWPEQRVVADVDGGRAVVGDRWPDPATRYLVMRSYLGRDERRAYLRSRPADQRRLLLRTIAAKDAVRRWLWDHGHGPVFPAEIVMAEDRAGRPLVRGPYATDLRISLDQVEGVAVAGVAEGRPAGVAVEVVEPRHRDFERLALTPGEQRLAVPEGYDRDTWLTCLWAAKEAAARATGRPGLEGRPTDFEVTELVDGRVCIGDRWIAFERIDVPSVRAGTTNPGKEHVVAWTLTDR